MTKARFQTLKPRLKVANLSRLPSQSSRPGAFGNSSTADDRVRGRARKDRRLRIATHDGFCCQICGRVTDFPDGECDHVQNLAAGGSEEDSNLAWVCREPCHRLKTQAEAAAVRGGW